MAEQTFYQKTARTWCPAAVHSGNGRFACVARIHDRVEVTLYEKWGEAQELADICGGVVKRLPLPVVARFNDSFGYRERSAASA
jgi:hypothetical protein